MTKRTTWPMRVEDGTKRVGTATIRDERVTASNWAARQLEKKTGVRAPDAFDEIVDGGGSDPFYIPPRKHEATVARGAEKKPAKYRNTKHVLNGITFDSGREMTRYVQLVAMQQRGEISDLRLQVRFELIKACVVAGKKVRKSEYIADFVYLDAAGGQVVEDVKGVKTAVYMLKRKLMQTIHGIVIKEIK
jgi:Protein of unknown function (DUF1064)